MQGFLTRLLNNKKASVLPMMAAAMIPLIGMIGAGLDLSRAYLAKARLQNACDAGALAARRAMASGVTLDDAAKAEGLKFFSFNFPEGLLGTPKVTPSFETREPDITIVHVTATAQVPTTLMRVFGKMTMEVTADCSADQDYVNNDIMLVLDVTGSMYCKQGNYSCSIEAANVSPSRIEALRGAAAALYDALAGAKQVRTRYGFMPYSMTVNVGADLPGWIRTSSTYHKCTDKQPQSKACTAWGADEKAPLPSPWAGCIEERSDYGGAEWPISVSSTVTKNDIDAEGTTEALKWQAYNETATVGEYNGTPVLASFCPKPATKLQEYATKDDFQKKIDALTGYNAGTEKFSGGVGGYTNHDIGIVWGMRYLSTTGLFKAENLPEFKPVGASKPIRVEKHIVFLTDGVMTADANSYNAYGIRSKQIRLTGSSNQTTAHTLRFQNACTRAKNMGATIWVIALDLDVTTDLRNCASGADHAYSTRNANLTTIFSAIGKGIGRLRIVQ